MQIVNVARGVFIKFVNAATCHLQQVLAGN
jgi:hypothetical protein